MPLPKEYDAPNKSMNHFNNEHTSRYDKELWPPPPQKKKKKKEENNIV